MSYNREKGNSFNEESVQKFLEDALEQVKNASSSDMESIELLKKLFKKNISFTRRGYVTAWLLKQALQNSRGRFSRTERFSRDHSNDRRAEKNQDKEKNERTERPSRSSEERTPRVQIDPASAAVIFIGIGRNRRVYPRDLVGLLVSVAGLDRERIGDIRVLANYSFIQLFAEDGEKVISALNGYEYRGRKLAVSYSKQKDVTSSEEKEVAKNEDAVSSAPVEESVPDGVSNEGHAVEESSESKFAEAQASFAEEQKSNPASTLANQEPYSETTDDGQVKSHFGSGEY